jgi:hypothetical protein
VGGKLRKQRPWSLKEAGTPPLNYLGIIRTWRRGSIEKNRSLKFQRLKSFTLRPVGSSGANKNFSRNGAETRIFYRSEAEGKNTQARRSGAKNFLFAERCLYIFKSMVSKELIQEFREITKAEYGLDLSFEEANNIGNDLVDFFDTLAKIDFEENRKGTLKK